jgi:MFS family permease
MAEHARKIGIWAGAFIFSPYLGPFLSGILSTHTTWRNTQWLNAAMIGLGAILIAFLCDETSYDTEMAESNPGGPASSMSGFVAHVKLLTGITGYKQHHTGAGRTWIDLCIMVSRPQFVALCCKCHFSLSVLKRLKFVNIADSFLYAYFYVGNWTQLYLDSISSTA